MDIPIRYISPVFRPPSEAQSLILPVTNGCSWNQCTYCEMYTAPQKKFGVRDEQETLEAIQRCGALYAKQVQRVFLGDGDAMVLSTRRLMTLLAAIKTHLPGVRRISTYCLPRNVRNKSVQELTDLREAGLSLAYIGAESGDDTVLQNRNRSFLDIFRRHEITSTDGGKTFGSTQNRYGSTRRSPEIQKGIFTSVDHDFGNVFQQVLLHDNLLNQGLIVLDFLRGKQGFDIVEFALVLE